VYAGIDPMNGKPRCLKETARTYDRAKAALTELQSLSTTSATRRPTSPLVSGVHDVQEVAARREATTSEAYVVLAGSGQTTHRERAEIPRRRRARNGNSRVFSVTLLHC
jgi:hypothetical protein